MTTKAKQNKTLTVTEHGGRGVVLAKLHLDSLSLTESMIEICTAEYQANQAEGRTCGTVRSGDEFMCSLQNTLIESGRYEKGKTLSNLMSRVRKAVNDGGQFEHASSAKAKKDAAEKKAGAKRGARQSVGEKAVVKLTIVKDAQPEDVAQGLRDAINGEKFRDSYAELAAFLIDALDEYQGK